MLPEDIVDAVEFHHEHTRATTTRLPAVIALADGMAHMAAAGVSGLSGEAEVDLLKALALEPESYERLLGEVSEALEGIEAVAAVK